MWPSVRRCCAASATSNERRVSHILFVFLDGFGLAPPGADNPLSLYEWPGLYPLIGARPLAGEEVREEGRLLVALDCGLGVEGLPQSATGQVSLLCGVNAPALLGQHLPAYPNARLRRVIEQGNLLKRVAEVGGAATFANSYTPEYFEAVRQRKLRHSATTLCVLAAGLRFRMVQDLLCGEAVHWDVTRARLRNRPGYESVPLASPEEAGDSLAGLVATHQLVLYECFLPDVIGHARDRSAAADLVRLLDTLLSACARRLPAGATLIVCADHGNVEDLSTPVHTRNSVPLMALGPAALRFATLRDISEVAPVVHDVLGIGRTPTTSTPAS